MTRSHSIGLPQRRSEGVDARRTRAWALGDDASTGLWVQGYSNKVHHAAGAYRRPMPMSLGPPYERCWTLCSSNPCIPLTLCTGVVVSEVTTGVPRS